MQSIKIVLKNLGKLVLKIEIDLGPEPKILSIMVFVRIAFLHHAIPL